MRHSRPFVNFFSDWSVCPAPGSEAAIGASHRQAKTTRRKIARDAEAARGMSLLLPCSRGGGLRESRQRLQAVGFEQLLQLRRGFPGSLDELRLVVLDRVLRFEPLLVVLLEQAHGALGGGDTETQGKQRVPRLVQARGKGFAPDELDTEIAQSKQMHAVTRAREDRNLREMLAHDRGGLH